MQFRRGICQTELQVVRLNKLGITLLFFVWLSAIVTVMRIGISKLKNILK